MTSDAARRGWPADASALAAARSFVAGLRGLVVVACDSDVDGLCSAVIAERAAAGIGARTVTLPIRRGEHVHAVAMRDRLLAEHPDAVIVLDMGSRPFPIDVGLPLLVIDHHDASLGGPPDALFVNGFDRSPVAPTSVLTYCVCGGLPGAGAETSWLAGLGAVADLGSAEPFTALLGAKTPKTTASRAAALLNAARRAADPAPQIALEWLRRSTSVHAVLTGEGPEHERLLAMQREVRGEIERCSRIPPAIGGEAALIRCSSGAQVHPVVATRWVQRLRPRIVIAANADYLPGRVNFAVRGGDGRDLLAWLRGLPYSPRDPGEYANGHPRATGGSLTPADFERLLEAAGFAVPGAVTRP